MTDEELLAAMAREMEACEEPLTAVLRPSTALQLVGLIQLALRHPGVDGPSRRTGRMFVDHVRHYFRDHYSLAVLEAIRRGDSDDGRFDG